MIRSLLALALLLCAAWPTLAAGGLRQVTIGYLSLENDPRYDQRVVYSGLVLKPLASPVKGAEMGMSDLEVLTAASGISVRLDEEQASDAAGLIARVKAM